MSRRTLPALVGETPLQPQPPALLVFGRDEGGKPRAAWFGAGDAKVATEAASAMKMRTLPLGIGTASPIAASIRRSTSSGSSRYDCFPPLVAER